MKKVDYFIIGAQKAGTTSIHDLLTQHPSIDTSILKENLFFSRENKFKQGTKHFQTLFNYKSLKGKVLGTSDVQLLPSSNGPKRLYEYNNNVKLIVILRDPVDRAYSAFNFAKQRGEINSKAKFLDEFENFKKVYSKSYIRSENDLFDVFYDGLYAKHLGKWLEVFPKDQLLILTLNELKNYQDKTLNKIFDFLGIEHVPITSKGHSNKTGKYKFAFLQNYLFNGKSKFVTLVGELLSVKAKLWLRKNVVLKIRNKSLVEIKIERLSVDERMVVEEFYREDKKELFEQYALRNL